MALVTWTCGHKSRVLGTEKGKAKYMVCRDCYNNPAPKVETEEQKKECAERAETQAAMSEIQNH